LTTKKFTFPGVTYESTNSPDIYPVLGAALNDHSMLSVEITVPAATVTAVAAEVAAISVVPKVAVPEATREDVGKGLKECNVAAQATLPEIVPANEYVPDVASN
jgi:hypothetical protein